jgi:site-specific DNA-methyltransferase (adenine-specific)
MKQTMELHKRWKDDPSKGEVFTPIELVREMLDKIPLSVWENPDSLFLDPCVGKGTFLIEIINRLVYIYGYSKEDAISRVYGYDVCVKYINYLKRGGLKNVFHKDFLNEEFNMKFDVVVGNPPYQSTETVRNINGGTNKKLWMSFLNKAILLTKEGGYVAMLVPTTWAAGAKNPHTNENIFQDIIKTKKIININMDEGKFFNVGIGISSLVFQNIDLKQNTIKLQGRDFEISEYSMLPKNVDDITLSIFNKIRNFQKMKFEFVRKSFKNDELSNSRTQEYPNPTYVGKNGIKYVNSFTKFDNMPKLLVHRMSFGSGGIQVLLDNEGTITPNYSNVYLLDGDDDGQYLKKIMESKLYNFLFQNLKYTQYNEARALSHLPKLPQNIDYSNEMIYSVFSLTNEEISFIESNVA